MLRVIVGGLVALAFLVFTAPALATEEAVCDNLDTGHLSAGDATSITINAPEGKLIIRVCVKAGSAVQGDGPEYTDYNPGVTSVTISHSTGKEISHYSVQYGDAPPPFDQCPNIPGNQPEGTDCTPPPTDVCPNIEGVQETVPPGMGIVNGECVPVDINPQCAPPQVFNPVTGLCEGGGTPPTVPCVYTGAGKDGQQDAFGGQNNDCAPLPPPFVPPGTQPTPITTPTLTTAPPTTTPVTKPPAVKPKPKPRKPAAKPKPKPKPKPKVVAKKPKPKTLTCLTGTRKYAGKCHPIVKGSG